MKSYQSLPLIVMLLSFSFISCEKEEDIGFFTLQGKWQLDNRRDEPPPLINRAEYDFKADSTYTHQVFLLNENQTQILGYQSIDSGNYILQNQQIQFSNIRSYYDTLNTEQGVAIQDLVYQTTNERGYTLGVIYDHKKKELTFDYTTFPCPINAICVGHLTYTQTP